MEAPLLTAAAPRSGRMQRREALPGRGVRRFPGDAAPPEAVRAEAAEARPTERQALIPELIQIGFGEEDFGAAALSQGAAVQTGEVQSGSVPTKTAQAVPSGTAPAPEQTARHQPIRIGWVDDNSWRVVKPGSVPERTQIGRAHV